MVSVTILAMMKMKPNVHKGLDHIFNQFTSSSFVFELKFYKIALRIILINEMNIIVFQ